MVMHLLQRTYVDMIKSLPMYDNLDLLLSHLLSPLLLVIVFL